MKRIKFQETWNRRCINDSLRTVDSVDNCGGGLTCSIILIGTRGCSTSTPDPRSGLISFMHWLRVGQSLQNVHLDLPVAHFLIHPEIFSCKYNNYLKQKHLSKIGWSKRKKKRKRWIPVKCFLLSIQALRLS
jgi:hypothetical protein